MISAGNELPAFKIAFLGDSSVGKTSIIQRFYDGTFQQDQDTTIGASFIQRDMDTEHGKIQLNIWDTAGQERYRSLVSTYTRGCNAAILCFAYNDYESFDHLEDWIDELEKQSKTA